MRNNFQPIPKQDYLTSDRLGRWHYVGIRLDSRCFRFRCRTALNWTKKVNIKIDTHQLFLLVARRLCSSAPFLIWPPFPPPLPGQPLQVCPLLLWSSKARGYQLSWPPSEPPQTPTNSVSHMGLIAFTLPEYRLLICRILWHQPQRQDWLQLPEERKLSSQLLCLFYPDNTIR